MHAQHQLEHARELRWYRCKVGSTPAWVIIRHRGEHRGHMASDANVFPLHTHR